MAADYKAFLLVFTRLASTFRVKTDDGMIEGYWSVMAGWSAEALDGGAQELMKNSRFFPKPVEWTEACEEWQWQNDHAPDPTRRRLAQSNEPPLTGEQVRVLVGAVRRRLGVRESEPEQVQQIMKRVLPGLGKEAGASDGG